MKAKHIFSTLACCLLVLASFSSFAEIKKQDRSVSGSFTKLSVSTAINLYVTQGSNTSVRVEADEDIIDQITTNVSNGKLIVKLEKGSNIRNTKEMKVYVTLPTVEEIAASAACNIVLETPLTSTGEVDVKLSAACSMSKANITAKKVEVDLTGASNMKDATIVADELDIELSGASNCSVSAKATNLSVEASGASSVKLSGEAKTVNAEASGASSIKSQNFTYDKLNKESSGSSSIKLSK